MVRFLMFLISAMLVTLSFWMSGYNFEIERSPEMFLWIALSLIAGMAAFTYPGDYPWE